MLLELLELHKASALDGIRNLNAGKPNVDQIAIRAAGCSAILQEVEGLMFTPTLVEDIIKAYEAHLRAAAEEAAEEHEQ